MSLNLTKVLRCQAERLDTLVQIGVRTQCYLETIVWHQTSGTETPYKSIQRWSNAVYLNPEWSQEGYIHSWLLSNSDGGFMFPIKCTWVIPLVSFSWCNRMCKKVRTWSIAWKPYLLWELWPKIWTRVSQLVILKVETKNSW